MGDLVLRRWRAEDADELYTTVRGCADHLRTWMPWASGYSLAAAREYVRTCEAGWERRAQFDYRIACADGESPGQVLGSTSLMARLGPGALEIGYWVRADRLRQGIATRAAAALTVTGLEVAGVERVEVHHDEANAASAAVPARLGYAPGGGYERIPGAHPDCPTGSAPSRLRSWVLHAADLAGSPAAALAG